MPENTGTIRRGFLGETPKLAILPTTCQPTQIGEYWTRAKKSFNHKKYVDLGLIQELSLELIHQNSH